MDIVGTIGDKLRYCVDLLHFNHRFIQDDTGIIHKESWFNQQQSGF